MPDTSFFERVYEVVRLVPYGRCTTYGAIAAFLGAPKSSRMVGWAMNASHSQANIPAHRVVNRNGMLTGRAHFDPPELMQALLENEGIQVIENQIQNFNSVFWNPAKNTFKP